MHIRQRNISYRLNRKKTMEKRFKDIGVENTEENRLKYRELLLTAPEINNYISGVILHEETTK